MATRKPAGGLACLGRFTGQRLRRGGFRPSPMDLFRSGRDWLPYCPLRTEDGEAKCGGEGPLASWIILLLVEAKVVCRRGECAPDQRLGQISRLESLCEDTPLRIRIGPLPRDVVASV